MGKGGARGTDGREYPYAGEYDPTKANTNDTDISANERGGHLPQWSLAVRCIGDERQRAGMVSEQV
ncbi:MAG: hypothetical protein U0Y68_19445 [Blastocatellia bacterium]